MATLGGSGRLEQAYADGRLNSSTGNLEGAQIYLEGVLNTFTFGAADKGADEFAIEGKSASTAIALGVGSGALNVAGAEQWSVITDGEANSWQKAEAASSLIAQYSLLAIGGLQAKGSKGQAGRHDINVLRPRASPTARTPAGAAALNRAVARRAGRSAESTAVTVSEATEALPRSAAEVANAPQLGGRHRATKSGGTTYGTESHHPIADAISPFLTNDAPAIRMGKAMEHPLTRSYKNSFRSQRFRHWQQRFLDAGEFDKALGLGVRDIVRVGKSLGNPEMFTEHLRQMFDSLPKRSDGGVDWSQIQTK